MEYASYDVVYESDLIVDSKQDYLKRIWSIQEQILSDSQKLGSKIFSWVCKSLI